VAGSWMLGLLWVNAPDIGTMATDGLSIWFNAAWCETHGVEKTMGVIAHEVLHVVNRHHLRRSERDGIVTLTLDGRPEALYYHHARITSCVGHTFPDPRQQMLPWSSSRPSQSSHSPGARALLLGFPCNSSPRLCRSFLTGAAFQHEAREIGASERQG
jgi:hypothetical protein